MYKTRYNNVTHLTTMLLEHVLIRKKHTHASKLVSSGKYIIRQPIHSPANLHKCSTAKSRSDSILAINFFHVDIRPNEIYVKQTCNRLFVTRKTHTQTRQNHRYTKRWHYARRRLHVRKTKKLIINSGLCEPHRSSFLGQLLRLSN